MKCGKMSKMAMNAKMAKLRAMKGKGNSMMTGYGNKMMMGGKKHMGMDMGGRRRRRKAKKVMEIMPEGGRRMRTMRPRKQMTKY